MNVKPIKPQPTLKGYTAWAFDRLIKVQGISQAEGASWVVERWLQAERQYLAEQYQISPEKFLEEVGAGILTGGTDDP